MFKGSLVALITPFRNGGYRREPRFRSSWPGRSDRGPTAWCRAAPPANRRRSTMTSTAGRRAVRRGGQGQGPGHRRNRHQFDRRTRSTLTREAKAAGADAALIVVPLLQQADAGGALPAFQGGARCGRSADRDLQHSRPLGGGHEQSDDGAPGQIAATSSGSRMRPTTSPGRSSMRVEIGGEFSHAYRARTRPPSPIWRRAATAASRSPPTWRRGCCSEMHEAWQKGDVATVRRINERLIPLHDALFAETSPAPVKYAASLLGKCDADGAPAVVADHARDPGEGGAGDARRGVAELSRRN